MATRKLEKSKAKAEVPLKSKSAKSTTKPAEAIARARSDFPKLSLRDTIQISEAIENKNGGQPMPPTDLAIAIAISPGSSTLRALLSASIKYNLSSGTEKAGRVQVNELGLRIVAPKSNEDKQAAIVLAILNPPTFRAIYDAFKGKKLPENQFFQNTVVRDFGVPREHAAACVSVFLENVEYAGLVREAATGRWLSADAKPQAIDEKLKNFEEEDDNDGSSDVDENKGSPPIEPQRAPIKLAGGVDSNDVRAKRVYITHGKNQSLVSHLKELLVFGQFDPIVSMDHETVSKPLPDKVMDDMRSCGAAIIHVDAEREMMTTDGQREIILNSNVLIEIGAAMALYGRRFILLKQKDVRLPSNLSGLYEVRYEGEKLDVDATLKLLKAFNDFKTYKPPTAAV